MTERIILDILIALNLATSVFNIVIAKRQQRQWKKLDKEAEDLIGHAKTNEMHARRNIAMGKKLRAIELQWAGLKQETKK
jgi:ribosomal protein L17